jgi:hypothetical protein
MNLDATTICINCGLPAGQQDLAGCTRDTETAHDFQSLSTRPFRDWEYEAIVARMERASMKGASAASMARHLADCEAAGLDTYAHRLYVQKAQKRLGLAQALGMELWLRARGDLVPYDDQLTFDEAEGIGLDGTGRDGNPRFPYRYSNLTPAEMKRLTHYRKARPFKLDRPDPLAPGPDGMVFGPWTGRGSGD